MLPNVLTEILVSYIFQLTPIVPVAGICVIHHCVDTAKLFMQTGNERFNRLPISDIQQSGLGPPRAHLIQFRYSTRRSFLVTIRHDGNTSMLNDCGAELPSENTRPTGHNDNFVC